ncbi:MAG: DUF393 domain-containing protein [Phycisphaerales bacterium]|nr:DUF393 domain-containing protein [Phycisphaerales bacterium]
MDPASAIVLYDGTCGMCSRGTARLRRIVPPEIAFVDFNQPGALDPYPALDPETCARRMHVVRSDGAVLGGFDALIWLLGAGPRRRWIRRVGGLPIVRHVGELAYRVVAANRHRWSGSTPTSCRRP